ncbi:MAG TPA: hypothetical protein VJG32_11240 [Anaerolineae bacterium]|nr:hypothetical protein [Anaerolineae bacterium]
MSILLIAACSPVPATQTPTLAPTPNPPPTRPPTWTPAPGSGPTQPATSSIPTRTLTPPVTPAALEVVVAEDNAFSLQIPSNWTITQGTRQVEGSSTYEVKYFAAVGPGDPPQPGVIIFYDWPSSLEVTNDNAWESAYALTALVIKSCGTQLGQEKLPVDFGSELAFGVEYVDSCGAAGLVTGAVHNGVNYGALFEAPASYFGDWFPMLRDILLSITFGQ